MRADVWMQTNYDTGPRLFISGVEESLARKIADNLAAELSGILQGSDTTVRVWTE